MICWRSLSKMKRTDNMLRSIMIFNNQLKLKPFIKTYSSIHYLVKRNTFL